MDETRKLTIIRRFDPVGRFVVEDARRTALLTIEEVLGGPGLHTPEPVSSDTEMGTARPPSPAVELPRLVPAPDPAPPSRRPRPRRWRRFRGRLGIVALTLGLAVLIGAVLGSGLLNSQDRFNADLYEAQLSGAEWYVIPQVQGHPGAEPARGRSDNIREFLGMARAF